MSQQFRSMAFSLRSDRGQPVVVQSASNASASEDLERGAGAGGTHRQRRPPLRPYLTDSGSTGLLDGVAGPPVVYDDVSRRRADELGGLNPNPPMDRDGRREDSGRGEGVTGAMIRARIWVDGRLAGGLQAFLGAPMAAYSGCGERDGGIGHGKRRSRTGLARVCGDVGLAGGSVADGRRQAGSGMARSRARARLNCSSQGQRRGRCRVNRRAERVIRPAKAKTRRLRVLVVTIC